MRIIRKNNYFEINGFVINRKYNYNEFTRNDEETGRTYNVGEHKVPSVTTILSKTQSQEKKQALDAWRERVGYQEAARITNQAAVRGTEMHYVLEQYCNGVGYLNISKEGALPRMMAHTIVDNLDLFSQVYGTEVSLSYKDLWAGSSDLIGVYDDKPTIIDFKQSNRPKREEWVEDYIDRINEVNRKIRQIDYKGYFEVDDEVGQVFEQLKEEVQSLEELTEVTDKEL